MLLLTAVTTSFAIDSPITWLLALLRKKILNGKKKGSVSCQRHNCITERKYILKSWLNGALSNLVLWKVSLPTAGGFGTRSSFKVSSNPNHFSTLWFCDPIWSHDHGKLWNTPFSLFVIFSALGIFYLM